MPKRHSETAFAPMCTPEKGEPWFAISFVRYYMRDARDAFIKASGGNGNPIAIWNTLRSEGWRIVRVKVVAQ
jgi:hypothetical protein